MYKFPSLGRIKSESSFVVRFKNKDGSPDLRYRENREIFCEKGLNKDGSEDMRLKSNRKLKKLIPDSESDQTD